MKLGKKTLSVILSVAMVATLTVSSTAVSSSATETTRKTASSFSWDNASVYFLLTDRFNNADTSNDHSYNRGLNRDGSVSTDILTDAGCFQGGDFKGITQKINEGYFDNLGVNALWISAPYEQAHGYTVGGDGAKSFPHYGYHGYYLLDYLNTDANFGTREEFKEMVDTAHSHGIRIVMDIVMNHPGYSTMYDMNEYGYGTLKSGWEDVYYDFGNINSTYYSKIDYDHNASDWAKWWGTDWIRAGIAGYTSGGNDDLTKGVDYLPDFRTDSTKEVDIPELLKTKWTKEGTYDTNVAKTNAWFTKNGYAKTPRNYQICWLADWVREYGIDGFRCDTAKHVDKEAWGALKAECVLALNEWKANNPDKVLDDSDFWTTGENYGMALEPSSDYYTTAGFDSMINFENGGGMPTIDKLNDKYVDYASKINSNDNFNVLTYISSHDDKMANAKSGADMYYQGSAFELLPGAIQIYYGDETNRQKLPMVKLPTGGRLALNDHALRSFMNWDEMDNDLLAHWQKVGQFRNNHVAVGAGQHSLISSSYTLPEGTTGSVVAFSRTYDKNGVKDAVACAITSFANTDVNLNVSSLFEDGTKVVNAYDGTQAVVTEGRVTFSSGEHNTILVEKYEEPVIEPPTEETPTEETPTGTTPTEVTPTEATSKSETPTNATDKASENTQSTSANNGGNNNNSNTNTGNTTTTTDTTGKVATGDSSTTAGMISLLLLAGATVTFAKRKIKE